MRAIPMWPVSRLSVRLTMTVWTLMRAATKNADRSADPVICRAVVRLSARPSAMKLFAHVRLVLKVTHTSPVLRSTVGPTWIVRRRRRATTTTALTRAQYPTHVWNQQSGIYFNRGSSIGRCQRPLVHPVGFTGRCERPLGLKELK